MVTKGTWSVSMTLTWKYPQSAEETAVRTYEVQAFSLQDAVEKAHKAAGTVYSQNINFPVGYSVTIQVGDYNSAYYAPQIVPGTTVTIQRIG